MEKPSYLGLLNALAVAETAAEPLFETWAATTSDKKLAKELRFVAMREGEHGKAFAKRMLELGYEVRTPPSLDRQAEALVTAAGSMSDSEKFRALGVHQPPGETDVFDSMFVDKTIDPITGALLGRYIAEERDSARRLAAQYERIAAKEGAVTPETPASARTKKSSRPKKPNKKWNET